ncbi:hypothetical protein BsWGS_10963 [Bradybaena similaris]
MYYFPFYSYHGWWGGGWQRACIRWSGPCVSPSTPENRWGKSTPGIIYADGLVKGKGKLSQYDSFSGLGRNAQTRIFRLKPGKCKVKAHLHQMILTDSAAKVGSGAHLVGLPWP